MTKREFTERDLDEWERLVSDHRHHGFHFDPSDGRAADEASANLCSGWGIYFHSPNQIATLIEHAIQIGYIRALSDVREGTVDGLGEVEDL